MEGKMKKGTYKLSVMLMTLIMIVSMMPLPGFVTGGSASKSASVPVPAKPEKRDPAYSHTR